MFSMCTVRLLLNGFDTINIGDNSCIFLIVYSAFPQQLIHRIFVMSQLFF